MENCLVTKLKEVVNNNNLPFFGEIRFNVSTAHEYSEAANQVSLFLSGSVTIKVIGTGSFKYKTSMGGSYGDAVTSLTTDASWLGVHLLATAGDYDICVIDKKNITGIYSIHNQDFTLRNITIALDKIDYSSITTIISYGGLIYGNISKVPYSLPNFTQMIFLYNGVTYGRQNLNGSLDALENTENLTNFVASWSNISGNINNLANNLGLTTLTVSETDANGSIESFAAAQVAAGRTSGICRVNAYNAQVTHDGNLITLTYVTEHGGSNGHIYVKYDSSVTGGYSISFTNPA